MFEELTDILKGYKWAIKTNDTFLGHIELFNDSPLNKV